MESAIDRQIELSNRFKNALETCGMTVNKNWLFKIYENSIEAILTQDESFERVFGADINMDYYKPFPGDKTPRKLQINCGSMGSFDLSCKASVEKHLLMAEFIKNFPVVEALTKQFCQSVENYNNDNQQD